MKASTEQVQKKQAEGAAAGSHGVPPRRLRVLHLLPDLVIGGGQMIVLNHLRHADLDRFVVHLATLRPQGELVEAAREAGFPPICLNHEDGRDLRTVARLVALLRRERIDILHVHSVVDQKLGQVAALCAGVPVVNHLHSCWDHLAVRVPDGAGPLRRLRARMTTCARNAVERRVAVQYIAESEAVRALFEPRVAAPVTVMRQAVGVDRIGTREAVEAGAQLRRELSIGDDQRVLLNISRLDRGKGHLTLVRVLAALAHDWPDVVLVVAGDGSERASIEAEAQRLGVSPRLRLLGTRMDVPEVLAAGDVFVFASEGEGFGLVVLEAMAASLPVVAYRLPPLEEFTAEGQNAYLLEIGDEKGFAQAIDSLFRDPSGARRMGANGRQSVERSFPADAAARSFEPVYERAGAARRRRALRGARR